MAPKVSKEQLEKMYIEEKLSMREIGEKVGCGIDAVVYAMRKYKINSRATAETNAIYYQRKNASFIIKPDFEQDEKLIIAGAMLYWAEGAKGKTTVDFVNSDPNMIIIFLKFLRNRYHLQENKFRILLYCYSDQDISELKAFWSTLTNIPFNQFSKPYIRSDYKEGRKMKYGVIHVRYSDKKLLLDILGLIETYSQ